MVLIAIICCSYSGKGKDDYHVMAYDKDSPQWSLNGEHNLIAINICMSVTVIVTT